MHKNQAKVSFPHFPALGGPVTALESLPTVRSFRFSQFLGKTLLTIAFWIS
jgi:hypothetical protein